MSTLIAMLMVLPLALGGDSMGWLINLALFLDTSGFRVIVSWYNNKPD